MLKGRDEREFRGLASIEDGLGPWRLLSDSVR
jgi:hypothetical protein